MKQSEAESWSGSVIALKSEGRGPVSAHAEPSELQI